MTAKQLWGYGKIALIAVGSFLAGNASTLWEAFQFFESRPSALIGYVNEPGADVRVYLNNGTEGQVADANNGFFRFDDLTRGTHNLRFESSKYHSFSQPVEVADPGQCELPTRIALTPRNVAVTEKAGPKIIAVALNFSADASEPLQAGTANSTTGLAFRREAPSEEFWIYVDDEQGAALTFGKDREVMVGATGSVEEPVVTRSSAPVRDFRISGYRVGTPTGRLEPGQQIVVTDTAMPRGSDKLWVKATVVDEGPSSGRD